MNIPDDEIFAGAIELDDADEQQQYVTSRCVDNREQRERILSMLGTYRQMNASDSVDVLLDRAEDLLSSLTEEEIEVQPGDHVDRYRIIEKLGHGGMGIVYAADQETPVKRSVALKLLKAGMDSQRLLGRFAIERKVLAQLNHPGITRVLDAGVQENGRPFFAMDLVPDAMRITDYCDRERLGIKARVRMMLSICQAVQHAHQRGVIHRDLKPSNILISGSEPQPRPRVIDFGVAKLVSPDDECDASQTMATERLGTPAYMSPEQALKPGGGADVRADIYSLGVILHELITGVVPVGDLKASDQRWTSEDFWASLPKLPSSHLQRASMTTDSAEARGCTAVELEKQVRGDLDAILLKALAPDRDERYGSVTEFQRDLERFLDGEAVEAAGYSRSYLFRKVIRRHRVLATTIAVSAVLIIAASVTAIASAIEANHNAALAGQNAVRAGRAEQQASARLAEVLRTQKELVQQRETAERASQRSLGLLRAFQVKSIADRAIKRLVNPLLTAIRFDEKKAAIRIIGRGEPVMANVLTSPDERLYIKGDWSWLNSTIDLSVATELTTSQLSSVELAAITAGYHADQSAAVPLHFPENGPVSTRFVFQMITLDELQKELPPDDILIAEVLDNCGLLAARENQPRAAVEFLRRGVQVWRKQPAHEANVAQTLLFLAEELLKEERIEEAAKTLGEAEATLSQIDTPLSERNQLVEFCGQLKQKLASAR